MAPILSKVTFAGVVAVIAVALLQGTDAKRIVAITADTTEYTMVGETAYSDDSCSTGRGELGLAGSYYAVANRCVKGMSEFYVKYTCPNGMNKPALLQQYNDEDCTSLNSTVLSTCVDNEGAAKKQLECFAPVPGSLLITNHNHKSQSECLAEMPTETPTMALVSYYAREPNACINTVTIDCNATSLKFSLYSNEGCSGESTVFATQDTLCDELTSVECISIIERKETEEPTVNTGSAGSVSTSIGAVAGAVIAVFLNANMM